LKPVLIQQISIHSPKKETAGRQGAHRYIPKLGFWVFFLKNTLEQVQFLNGGES